MKREIRWKLFREDGKVIETSAFLKNGRPESSHKLHDDVSKKRRIILNWSVWEATFGTVTISFFSFRFRMVMRKIWGINERPPDGEKLYILDRALWCSRLKYFCVEVYIRTLSMVMMTHEWIERSMSPQRHNWSTWCSFVAVMIRSIIYLILQLDVCFIIFQPF